MIRNLLGVIPQELCQLHNLIKNFCLFQTRSGAECHGSSINYPYV